MLKELQDELNLSADDIERIKKEESEVRLNRPILVGLVLVVLLWLIMRAFDIYQGLFLLIIVGAILLGLLIYLYFKELSEYNLIVKEIVILKMFEKEFDKVNYQPLKGFDKQYINDTNLIGSGNNYSSDDLLSGSYKGIGFIQADVFLEQVTQHEKHTSRVTIFKGRWIVCDFIKEFSGFHQIRSQEFLWTNKKPSRFFGRSSKLIKFEDLDFNKEFSTYSDNEQEAFYLISPNYMHKIRALKAYVDAPLILGFVDNKLHIAINDNSDAFEVKGRKINREFIESVKKEIDVIKVVLDNLELDTDIFR